MVLLVEGKSDLLVLSTIIKHIKYYKEITNFYHNWIDELDATWKFLGRNLDKNRKKRLTNNSNIILVISGEGKPNIYNKLANLIKSLNIHKRRYENIQLKNVFLIIDDDNICINKIITIIANKLNLQNSTSNIHNKHYATVTLPTVEIHIITISPSLNHILSKFNINPSQLNQQLTLPTQLINSLLDNSCINDLLQLI